MVEKDKVNGKFVDQADHFTISADAIPILPAIEEADSMATKKEEPQLKLVPVLGIVVTVLIFIIGGLFGYIATTSRDKGYMEGQIQSLEKQVQELKDELKRELREGLDYQRTQNEVLGKQYSEMKGRFEAMEGRRMR